MSVIEKPIFINEFSKGTTENSNIGIGTLVGIETYSKKGVAQLTKDTTKQSGSIVTDLIISTTAIDINTIVGQGETGKVYKSINKGATWTDISPGTITGGGQGIIFYEDFVFAFRGANIDYLSSPYTAANWTQGWQTDLNAGFGHFPFLFPNDNSVYFGNQNMVGKIGFGTASAFNPAGSAGTDYFYQSNRLILPEQYIVNCISYLPTNFLELGTGSSANPQIADIIPWNPTLSTFETPLNLYSTSSDNGISGVAQIVNRNNILYAVTTGNHCVFETNGTTFNLVTDISLRMNVRGSAGAQLTQPIFLYPHPDAIAVIGNKILTGTTSISINTPNGYFPSGIWSVAFTDEGQAIQCEYTISTGTTIAQDTFQIGSIFPVGNNQSIISWRDNLNFGVDLVQVFNYQNDINTVIIESQMLEIGTPLSPATFKNVQFNLTRNLLVGQKINVYYRTSFDQDFVFMPSSSGGTNTFDPTFDGINTGYKITNNNAGATRFLQFRIQMSTDGTLTPELTPEIRNIIVQ